MNSKFAFAPEEKVRFDPNVFLALVLAGIVFAILKLPSGWSEVAVAVGVYFSAIVALRNFSAVWIIFLLVLPFISLVTGLLGEPKLGALRLLLVVFAAMLVLRKTSHPFLSRLIRSPVVGTYALFVFANLAAAVRVLEPESVFRALTYVEPLLFLIVTYCVVMENSANTRSIIKALVIGGSIVVALGIVEFVLKRPILDIFNIRTTEDLTITIMDDRFGLGGRLVSIIGQPVYAAMYFVVWWLLTIAYMAIYKPKSKLVRLALIPFGVLLVLLTGSRGPLLAVGVTLLFFLAITRPRISTSILLVGGIGLGLFVTRTLLPGMWEYISDSLTFDPNRTAAANAIGRLSLTRTLLEVFRQNPILGFGPGLIQKLALVGDYRFATLGGQENQYAVILADGGIVAGIAYLMFMVTTLVTALRISSSAEQKVALLGRFMFLATVFYFVVVTTATTLSMLPNYLVMTLIGLALANYEQVPPGEESHSRDALGG